MNPSAPAYTPPFRGVQLTGGAATHRTSAPSQDRDQTNLVAGGQAATGSRTDDANGGEFDHPHNNNNSIMNTNITDTEVAVNAAVINTIGHPSPSPSRTGHAAAVQATTTTTNAASINPSISPDKENQVPAATTTAPLAPSALRPSLARGALLRGGGGGGGSPIERASITETAVVLSTPAAVVLPTARTINASSALVAAEMMVIDAAIAEGQGKAHSQPYTSSRQFLAPQYYQQQLHQQHHHHNHNHAASTSSSRSLSPPIISGGGMETTMGIDVYPRQYHHASCGGGNNNFPQQLNSTAAASLSYSGAYLPTAAPHHLHPHPHHSHAMQYHGGSMPLLSGGSSASSASRMSPPTSSMVRQRSPLSTLYTAPSSSPSSAAASKSPSASLSPSVSVSSPTSVRQHRLPSPQEAIEDEKNTCIIRPTPTTRSVNVGVSVGAAPKLDSTPPPAQSSTKGNRSAGSGGSGQHNNKNSNINNINGTTPTKTSAKTSNNNNNGSGTGNTPNRFFFSSDVDAVPIPPPNTCVRVGVSVPFSSTPASMSSSPLTSPTSAIPRNSGGAGVGGGLGAYSYSSPQSRSHNSSPAVGFPPPTAACGSGNRSSGSSPRPTPYPPLMNGGGASNNRRGGGGEGLHGVTNRFSSLSPTSSGSTTATAGKGHRAGTSPTDATTTAARYSTDTNKYTFNNNTNANTNMNISTATRATPARNTTHADAHQLVERQERSASPCADLPSASLLTPTRSREEIGVTVGRSFGGEGGAADVENLDASALQRRQEQREKQISFGYNTDGYKNMLRLVEHDPRLKLGGVLPIEPPPPTLRSSKRTYDIYLRKWRRALHMFDYVFIDGSEDEQTTTRGAVLEQQRLKWVSPVHHVHHTTASGVKTLASVAPSADRNENADICNKDNTTACVEGTPMRPSQPNIHHYNNGAGAVQMGCTSPTPPREVDMVTPVKSASQPSMATIITTGPRVFLSRELMLSKRLSPAVPRKIPVEDALRHYLRSPDCYEPLTTLIPQSALYNTKGTSFTAGDVGFKIVIAPSTVAGPYATARSPSPEVPDFAPSPPIALLNGGGSSSNNNNNNGSAFSSPTSAAARGRSSASGPVAAAGSSVSKSATNGGGGGGGTVSSSDRSKNISKGTAAGQANEQDEGERRAHQPLFDALAATPSRQLTAAFTQSAGPSPHAAYTAASHLASASSASPARMGLIASAGTSAFLVPPPPLPPPLPASSTSTDMGAGARVMGTAGVSVGGSGTSLNANAVPFSFGSLSAHMPPSTVAVAHATQSLASQHRPQLLRGAAPAPVSAVVVGGGGGGTPQHVSRTSATSKPTPFRCQLSPMGSNGAQTLRTSASSSLSPSSSSRVSLSPVQCDGLVDAHCGSNTNQNNGNNNPSTTMNITNGIEGNSSNSLLSTPSPVIEIRVDEENANNNRDISDCSPPQSHAVETTNSTNDSSRLLDNVTTASAANTSLHTDGIAVCAKGVGVGGDNNNHHVHGQSAVPTSAASPSPRPFEGDERLGDQSASNSTILGDNEAPKCVGGEGEQREEKEEVINARCEGGDNDTTVSSSATRRLMHEYMDE